MRTEFGIALALLAVVAAPAAWAEPVTDAAACETYEGWVAFNTQWSNDITGALTAGTLKPEVYEYITGRAEALAKALPVKPTPADLVQYCEYLNALYAR